MKRNIPRRYPLIASPADGDNVAIRTPGEVVRRYSYRRTGEGTHNRNQKPIPNYFWSDQARASLTNQRT